MLEIPGYILDSGWLIWTLWLVFNVIFSIVVMRAKTRAPRNRELTAGDEISQTKGEIGESFSPNPITKRNTDLKPSKITCSTCQGEGWVRCQCEVCKGEGKV